MAKEKQEQLTPAEAVYAFVGWLTARTTPTIMSAKHNAAPVADRVAEFLNAYEIEQPTADFQKKVKKLKLI
jgi:hypothetical protein